MEKMTYDFSGIYGEPSASLLQKHDKDALGIMLTHIKSGQGVIVEAREGQRRSIAIIVYDFAFLLLNIELDGKRAVDWLCEVMGVKFEDIKDRYVEI